jgi:hypothetical protein
MIRFVSIDTLRSNRVLLMFLIVFVPIHMIGIGDHGFWYDETISGIVSFYPVSELIKDRLSNSHFPTYFLLLKFWGELFGKSEVSLRIPSLLFMTGAFGAFWLICRRYFALIPEAAVLALVLFFFHPTVIKVSQEARMYGPLLCLTLFSSYFFLVYLETSGKRPLLFCIAFLMAAITIHAQALILLLVQLSYLLLRHRPLITRYLAYLSVPLILFLLLWKSGSGDYSVSHRRLNIAPEAIKIVSERAGLIAAGESDAYIFRNPPWSKLILEANVVFGLFLASCTFWLFNRSAAVGVAAEIKHEEEEKHRLALSYLLYQFIFFYGVLIILGILNFREPHRVRYQITVFPVLVLIVAVGALNLGAFLQAIWHSYQKVIYGFQFSRSEKNSKEIDISYIASSCIAGIVVLAFAYLYLYALNIQVNWRGPGFKEAIILIKENYQEGDSVITCCMPKMYYGFNYFGAEDISNRLDLSIIEVASLSRKKQTTRKQAAEKKIQRATHQSNRVWLLFYRDKYMIRKPIIDAINKIKPEHEKFFSQKFSAAQLQGYEKDDDPLDKMKRLQK